MISMKHVIICALLALGTIGFEPRAALHQPSTTNQAHRSTQLGDKCTSIPCANTASGEDPQDIAIWDAWRERNTKSEVGEDRARWKRTLYSDSTRAADLKLHLVKIANFSMYLTPENGQIRFEHPGIHDAFQLELPRNTANSLCPEYTIDVVTASKQYAVIRKSCLLHQYKKDRYSMGATYYIYDVGTHTMRTIWQSQTNGQDDPFPDPNSDPMVIAVKNGIRINWKATYPAEGKTRSFNIKTFYLRKKSYDNTELVCFDLSAPSSENAEVGACEGGAVQRVNSGAR